MKTKYLFCLSVLVLGLMACDNYFDEKYLDNGDPHVPVAQSYEYTLTSSDYSTIAKNASNQALAAMLDSLAGEGVTLNQEALARVGSAKYFDTIALPAKYVPAFLHSKFPHFANGAVVKVTYNMFEGLPAFLDIFNQTVRYILTTADYKAIWGVDGIKYLTPATLSKLPQVLPQVDDNYMAGVVFDFSSKEPEDGGAVEERREVLYIYKDGVIWQPYKNEECPAFILPNAANGQVLNYLKLNYPYAQKDDSVVVLRYNSSAQLYGATEYKHDGTEFVAVTGISEERTSFGLGDMWEELPVYYRQAVAGDDDQGELVIQDLEMQEGITYIWAFDKKYGMKGTAYLGGPHFGEGWFVTPGITLKRSRKPALSFDMAMNFGPTPDKGRYEQATVWVSTDYNPEEPDVRTATWTQLEWNMFDESTEIGFPEANSWTFYNTGYLDLSAWNNETIFIGFRYKSEPDQTCSTWEVKNILVNEP